MRQSVKTLMPNKRKFFDHLNFQLCKKVLFMMNRKILHFNKHDASISVSISQLTFKKVPVF